jgi:hypothetical protein
MKKELETIKRIRSLLPEGLHVGGSFALKKFFFDSEHIQPKDLDLFYYGSRPMERWAFILSLTAIGFEILKHGMAYDGNYKIPGQYWYFKLKDKITSVTFDLIFIESNMLKHSLGSTFAGIQYKVNYSEDVLVTPYDGVLKDCIDFIKYDGVVEVFKSRNTETQLEKVRKRAELLGLRLKSYE